MRISVEGKVKFSFWQSSAAAHLLKSNGGCPPGDFLRDDMSQPIQKAQFQIGHCDIWVITRGCEHGKGLDVNIGNIFLTRQSVRANYVRESVKDKVSLPTGFVGLTQDIQADLDSILHHSSNLFNEVKARVIEATAQFFRVAGQGDKLNSFSFDKILEAGRSRQFDRVPSRHQTKRKGKEWLYVAARTIAEDGDLHRNILPCEPCYTANLPGGIMSRIGILHPGEMGVSVAASAINSGHEAYWVSRNRSEKTLQRAEEHGLIDISSLKELCQTCEIIFSVCPPHAAEDIAESVIEEKFKGFYLDANAVSPQRAVNIGQRMQANGILFVDGGIIGGPAWKPGETWLYLCGEGSDTIADCFSNGPLEVKIIGNQIGKASALKMCYAAYSKGTTALLAAILATAESLGVRDELYQQWDVDNAGFVDQVNRRMRRVTTKAWRFEGEMREIASTFRDAGLPDGFHEAAAEIYHRMAGFKDRSQHPELDEVLGDLLNNR